MKNILILVAFMTISMITYCQNDKPKFNNKHEEIKAQKVAFLTNKLNLTVEEAQQFWPLYNEMETKIDAIRKNSRATIDKVKQNMDNLSDEEIEKLLDEQINCKNNMVKIENDYYEKFKKVLPIKKVWKLNQAEKEFTHQLLYKLKHPHGGGPGPRNCAKECNQDFILTN